MNSEFNRKAMEDFCDNITNIINNGEELPDLFNNCPACRYAFKKMIEDKNGYNTCQHCPIDTTGKPGFTYWDSFVDETFYVQEYPYCYLNDVILATSKQRQLQVLEQFKNAKFKRDVE